MSLDRSDLPEHHLKYEIDMFLLAAATTSNANSVLGLVSPFKEAILNLSLESYLVHLRNLKDFLWEKPVMDDISAGQFCSKDCSRISNKKNDTLAGLTIDQIDARINKQISHLTRERKEKTRQQLTWDIKQLTCGMVDFLEQFISNVDRIDAEYQNAIKQTLVNFKNQYCLKSVNLTYQLSSGQSTTAVTTTVSFSAYAPLASSFSPKDICGEDSKMA